MAFLPLAHMTAHMTVDEIRAQIPLWHLQVIRRRTQYQLQKAEARDHIVQVRALLWQLKR